MNNEQNTTKNSSKIISKPRIISGVTLIILSIVLTLSFGSYLMNWKADQSQAGTMTDKTVESSNLFGKIGDWLGNLFIFESIGVAAFVVAFLFLVFGTLIFKKNYFKPWKTISHSLFFICWTPIFFGAVTNGEGVLGGVYGYQIMDYLKSYIGSVGLWMVLLVSFSLYFVLEFNLRPSSIKNKLNDLNDNTFGKLKSMMPDSNEEFEADEDLDKEIVPEKLAVNQTPLKTDNDFGNIKVTQEFEPIKTPNKTTFVEEVKQSQPEQIVLTTETPVQKPIVDKPIIIEKPVVEEKVDESEFTFINKSTESNKIQERRNKLKEFNSRYQKFDQVEEFESIPAFRRKNIDIDSNSASDSNINNFLSDNNGRVQLRENKFLNKDVD